MSSMWLVFMWPCNCDLFSRIYYQSFSLYESNIKAMDISLINSFYVHWLLIQTNLFCILQQSIEKIQNVILIMKNNHP